MTDLRRLGGSFVGVVAALAGCARPASPPARPLALTRSEQLQTVTALGAGDWRRALVGRWNVTFTLDSVSVGARDAPAVWRRVGNQTVSSELIVYDSLVQAFPALGLRRSALPNFRPALERSLSCSEPDLLILGVQRLERGGVGLDFTPEARDCGLRATVSGTQDSLSGRWHEPSIGLAVAVGGIQLVRQR